MADWRPYMEAQFHRRRGRTPDPRYADFRAACAADPTLAAELRTEFLRLDTTKRGGMALIKCDAISKWHHETLGEMLTMLEQPHG